MRVLIISGDHEFQQPDSGILSREIPMQVVRADKDLFERFVTSRIRSMGAGLIAEEWIPGRRSVPEAIASNLGVRHECVDMSVKEREQAGIPLDYADDPHLAESLKQQFHLQREQYMVSRTEEVVRDVAACIFICGQTHAAGLELLFSKRGHSVERVNFLDQQGLDLRWLNSKLQSG